jgi:tetratricopeptide (TPR) repeat protein
MQEMTMDEYWDFFQKRWSTRQLVDSLCQGNLKFVPGAKFSYSSAGYILLGAIIEEVTGKSYAQVLSEYILEPYRFQGTGVDNPQDIVPKRASGYQTNYGLGNARFKYMPSSHASGSLYSTVRDLFIWDQLLRSDFLSIKSKELMYSPQIESHRGPFGYGWFIDTVRVAESFQTRVFHAGDVSGFCALYVRVLESGDFVALLSNQEGLNYYDIAFSLLDLLNGITPEDPREYLSDVLREVYFSEGLEALNSRYSSLEAEDLEDFTIDEDEINELGYDILTVGDAAGAIQVFKINVDLHPNSANAYDSLGEGFLVLGDLEMAVENYKKSLKLDPESTNAKNMIESIRKNQKH